MFQYEYFKETRDVGGDTVGWMILKTADTKENERIMRDIDALFANSPFETETKTEQAFNKAFIEMMGDIGSIVLYVVGAAFITILLVVGNTMMLTVRERTNEIAVLKTIGFTAQRVFALVLGESMLLALIGGVLGVLAAFLITSAIAQSVSVLATMTLTLDTAIIAFVLMALLGLLTGLLPAIRAMNIDVVTALGRK
jgi:putative ABC transport system permease protein